VYQRHSRAIKVLGLASAFLRVAQFSQAGVFAADGVRFVFMFFSFRFLSASLHHW
jgi:hypothetical protein